MSAHQSLYLSLKTFSASSVSCISNPRRKNRYKTVQRFNVYIFYTFVLAAFTAAQTVSLSGIIIDAVTHLPISNAVVSLHETGEKKITNEHGFFQFSIQSNEQFTISIHHFAYTDGEKIITIEGTSIDTITITLRSKIFQSDGITISSTRITADVGNTPFPVSVQIAQELERNNIVTISDGLKTTPGVSIVRDGVWETAVSIRGMSRSNIIMLVDNSRMETANDIAGALSLFNPHDLERIETIRSSGAALYGTGALGGIIHMVSKQAAFSEKSTVSSELSSEISSVNNYTAEHLAIEGSSERYAVRLSGGYRTANNTVTPDGILPNSQFTDFNFSGSVGLKTFEDQAITLSYQRSQGENIGITGGSPIAATATATYKLVRRELFKGEYLIPNVSQKMSLLAIRFSQQNIYRTVEIVQTPMLTMTPHALHSTTSAQIESKITPADNIYSVLGADIWQRTLESKREKINKTNNTITGERPIPDSRFFSAGLFGQNEWVVVPERVILVFGARYDRINIHNEETWNPEYVITHNILQTSPTGQIILWKEGSSSNESWSGTMGMQYSFYGNLNVNFLASTAFRSPSLEERFQYLTLGDGIHVGNPDLKPERSLGLNAGFYWHTAETNIRTDFFLNTLTDLVIDVPGFFEGNAAFVKQNISNARLYGYEITGQQLFTSWSSMNFSISYVRGEDTYHHSNLSQISPLHGNIELTIREQGAGRLSLSTSMSAPQEYLGAGEKRTSGYIVFDIDAASVPIEFDRFSITTRVGIQNIFNKAFRNHLSTIRGTVTSEPGRNFFLSVTIMV